MKKAENERFTDLSPLEAIQLKNVERDIEFWKKLGHNSVISKGLTPCVAQMLKRKGYSLSVTKLGSTMITWQ